MTIEKELQAIISKEVEKQLVNRGIASKGWTIDNTTKTLRGCSAFIVQETNKLEKRLDSQQKQINKLFAEIREGKKKVDYSAFTVQTMDRNHFFIANDAAIGEDRYLHKDGTVKKGCGAENFFSSKQEAQDFLDGLQGKTFKAKLPRVGQLCYVWDSFEDNKKIRKFEYFSESFGRQLFIDKQLSPWNHWSFIPTEDIL